LPRLPGHRDNAGAEGPCCLVVETTPASEIGPWEIEEYLVWEGAQYALLPKAAVQPHYQVIGGFRAREAQVCWQHPGPVPGSPPPAPEDPAPPLTACPHCGSREFNWQGWVEATQPLLLNAAGEIEWQNWTLPGEHPDLCLGISCADCEHPFLPQHFGKDLGWSLEEWLHTVRQLLRAEEGKEPATW